MKNILNKIYIHPLTLLTMLIFILIGRFRLIIYFMLLIIVHEIGHIISSLMFRWKIDKIIILPFGGLIKYNKMINTYIIEDFIVSISGIIYQSFFYMLIHNLINYNYFSYIHFFILVFNLLPIYPLDGSKILNSLFSMFFSFYNSMKISIYISYFFLSILLVLSLVYNRLLFIVLLFPLINTYKCKKNIFLIFNKFLFERYIYKIKYKKIKIISKAKKMKKNYNHIFLVDNIYLSEDNYLKLIFNKKNFNIKNKS